MNDFLCNLMSSHSVGSSCVWGMIALQIRGCSLSNIAKHGSRPNTFIPARHSTKAAYKQTSVLKSKVIRPKLQSVLRRLGINLGFFQVAHQNKTSCVLKILSVPNSKTITWFLTHSMCAMGLQHFCRQYKL